MSKELLVDRWRLIKLRVAQHLTRYPQTKVTYPDAPGGVADDLDGMFVLTHESGRKLDVAFHERLETDDCHTLSYLAVFVLFENGSAIVGKQRNGRAKINMDYPGYHKISSKEDIEYVRSICATLDQVDLTRDSGTTIENVLDVIIPLF